MSLPTRGAWIEISVVEYASSTESSLPTRGAWIEIVFYGHIHAFLPVAPHTGSVD